MYLFFDAVSTQGYIGLFNVQKDVLAEKYFCVQGSESTQLPSLIDIFLQEHNTSYQQIENIICVVGPGSFTGIRIATLVINTISYIYPHIFLTPISFFDLYDHYPIIKTSSKRDLFVKWEKSATIQILSYTDFETQIASGQVCYGNAEKQREERGYFLEETYIPQHILSRTTLQNMKKVAPLYIKKPNIS